jgi:transposase
MNTHKVQDFVVKGKEVFVGLEDSKKTWKIAVRCDRMIIHQVSMAAKYPVLARYLENKFPECTIHVIYEAGFKGFNLFDRLTEDGIDCVVIPPHLVTEPKINRVKTDKRDANRLALVLENHDFKSPCHVPDKERREDRQVSRTLIGIQKDIICTRNRIRKLLDFHSIEAPFSGKWARKEFVALKELPLGESLKTSITVLLTQLEQLWDHQKSLRESLRQLCRKERYRLAFEIVKSLPGIGWFSAIRLVLELGEDLSHFTSGKKIASFVGLTCGTCQ